MLLLLGIDLDDPTTMWVIIVTLAVLALVGLIGLYVLLKIAPKIKITSSPPIAKTPRLVVPSADTISSDPERREQLRARISSMGYVHRAGHAPSSHPEHAGKIYSEFYAMVGGQSVPVRRRYRHDGIIHDSQGEQEARRIAQALGFNLSVL